MKGRLSRKQSTILDELFNSEQNMSEQQILQKHGVNEADYRRWQSEPVFVLEFEARMEALGRRSRLLIARYASYAAAKLIALTESENQETARKACLDIIDRIQKAENGGQNAESGIETSELSPQCQIAPELAEKILESLADRE
jgi:hypothetical protein